MLIRPSRNEPARSLTFFICVLCMLASCTNPKSSPTEAEEAELVQTIRNEDTRQYSLRAETALYGLYRDSLTTPTFRFVDAFLANRENNKQLRMDAAIAATGSRGQNRASLDILLGIVKSDSEPSDLRMACAVSLEKFHGTAEDAQNEMIQIMLDPSQLNSVRSSMAKALSKFQGNDRIEAAYMALLKKTDLDNALMDNLADSVSAFKSLSTDDQEIIVSLFRDRSVDSYRREKLAKCLALKRGRSHDELLSHLLDMSRSKNSTELEIAAASLGYFSNDADVTIWALCDLISSSIGSRDYANVRTSVMSLSKYGAKARDAIPSLKKARESIDVNDSLGRRAADAVDNAIRNIGSTN